MKLKFNGKVDDDGKFTLNNPKKFKESIKYYRNKNVTITFEKTVKKRSLNQNSYYWGAVIPIIQEGYLSAGYRYTKDEVHDELKAAFSKGEKINEETGEIKTFIKSTSEHTTLEFMTYIQTIQQWASEDLGVVIPDPGEQLEAEFEDYMFTPFSNGSEAVSWFDTNCENCKHANHKTMGLSYQETRNLILKGKECAAKFQIELGFVRGEVEKEPIATIIGITDERINAKCRKFEKK